MTSILQKIAVGCITALLAVSSLFLVGCGGGDDSNSQDNCYGDDLPATKSD